MPSILSDKVSESNVSSGPSGMRFSGRKAGRGAEPGDGSEFLRSAPLLVLLESNTIEVRIEQRLRDIDPTGYSSQKRQYENSDAGFGNARAPHPVSPVQVDFKSRNNISVGGSRQGQVWPTRLRRLDINLRFGGTHAGGPGKRVFFKKFCQGYDMHNCFRRRTPHPGME